MPCPLLVACEGTVLVVRQADPTDARAKIGLFTNSGALWLEGFRGAISQAEAAMRDELGDPRMDDLSAVLRAYAGHFDTLAPEGSKAAP